MTYSGMPQIQSAFNGWESRIVLRRHREVVVAGLVTIQEKLVSFYGVIQPLNARQIELKPEGQRSFNWLQIHCRAQSVTLIPGDRISYQGRLYKVTGDNPYDLNGYREYHAVQDWQGDAGGCCDS